MKLWQELAFFAKRIEKWILSTPIEMADTKYVRSAWVIYSDKVFQNDLTWNIIQTAYNNANGEDDISKIKEIINDVQNWREISLEDINTYDAIGNVAGIEWTEYGIDIKYFQELKSMIAKSGFLDFRLRTNSNGLLAFTTLNNKSDDKMEDLLLITWLQTIQRSLLD